MSLCNTYLTFYVTGSGVGGDDTGMSKADIVPLVELPTGENAVVKKIDKYSDIYSGIRSINFQDLQ